MKNPNNNSLPYLTIQEYTCCQIEAFKVEIKSHLGQSADVHYFKVTLQHPDSETKKSGLLRVGSFDGGLSRELKLREVLGNYKMVSELLAAVEEDSVYVSASLPIIEKKQEENYTFAKSQEELTQAIESNNSKKNISEEEHKQEYLE